MTSISTIMIPFETWGGIATILFTIIISIKLIRRKVTLRQIFISSTIFVFAMLFLYYNLRDIDVINNLEGLFKEIKNTVGYKNFIPFVWLLTDMLGSLKSNYATTLLSQYISTFIFALVFALLLPQRYKLKKTYSFLIISTVIFSLIETIMFFETVVGGSGIFFDTGNLLLIIIGLYCGRIIGEYIEKKRCKND